MFFKKKSGDGSGGETTDVELGTSTQIQTSGRRKRNHKEEEEWEDTEYKPIDWKKVFLTPKYIRTSTFWTAQRAAAASGRGLCDRRAHLLEP